MPVVLNKVERGKPMDEAAPKKWYITSKTLSQLKENEVAKQIANETTLNPKEAEMAISQLQRILLLNLLSSNSVQLGDWGSFYLTCNSEGADTKEMLTANSISRLNIRFKPGKAIKDALKEATFVFAEDLVSKKE